MIVIVFEKRSSIVHIDIPYRSAILCFSSRTE